MARKYFLEDLTRKQIAYHVKEDLRDSEHLMKEVYEECANREELEIVYAEMRRIITWLGEKGGKP